MIRYWILQGDPTSSGGVVVEATAKVRANPGDGGTRPVALIGGLATCGLCGSPGKIIAAPPRVSWIPKFNGVDVALSGDYVACKCKRPPVLINTSYKQSVSIHSDGVATVQPPFQEAFSSTGAIAAALEEDEIIEHWYTIEDESGNPVKGYNYDLYQNEERVTHRGSFNSGKTDVVQGGESDFVMWLERDSAKRDLGD